MPVYEYHFMVNYGQGWEHETTEDSRNEALQQSQCYAINCPEYPTKIKRVLVGELG